MPSSGYFENSRHLLKIWKTQLYTWTTKTCSGKTGQLSALPYECPIDNHVSVRISIPRGVTSLSPEHRSYVLGSPPFKTANLFVEQVTFK